MWEDLKEKKRRRQESKDEERKEWARKYREAAEAYLGGPKVEAAAVLEREHPEGELGDLISLGQRAYEQTTKGRAGSLPFSFLLAVTDEKVYALEYRTRRKEFEVREQIEVFDRDEIRLRAEFGYLILDAIDEGGTHPFHLRGKVDKTPGAAEVIAALPE